MIAKESVKLDETYGGNRIGLVVGATVPEQLAKVRTIVGDMSLLIPGLGAQEGDEKSAVEAGQTKDGNGMIINSSRGIIYADNYYQAAKDFRNSTNRFRIN